MPLIYSQPRHPACLVDLLYSSNLSDWTATQRATNLAYQRHPTRHPIRRLLATTERPTSKDTRKAGRFRRGNVPDVAFVPALHLFRPSYSFLSSTTLRSFTLALRSEHGRKMECAPSLSLLLDVRKWPSLFLFCFRSIPRVVRFL